MMMMGEVACSLMLTLLCSSLVSSESRTSPVTGESGGKRKCDLSGMWVNDLGSKMVLSPVNEVGEFAGSYLTAVTASPNRILESPLKGSQHPTKKRAHPTFGFTVTWQHSDSTAVFVGQCFLDENGQEILKTMWLLRDWVTSYSDDWKATRVGTNIFTRVE